MKLSFMNSILVSEALCLWRVYVKVITTFGHLNFCFPVWKYTTKINTKYLRDESDAWRRRSSQKIWTSCVSNFRLISQKISVQWECVCLQYRTLPLGDSRTPPSPLCFEWYDIGIHFLIFIQYIATIFIQCMKYNLFRSSMRSLADFDMNPTSKNNTCAV